MLSQESITSLTVLLLIILVVVGGYYYPVWRTRRILSRPLPDSWLAIIKRRLPFLGSLSDSEQQQMINNVQLFIARKKFYGCGGLTMTDEIKVTIAAEACLLLLNRPTRVYPRLKHILVYPFAFKNDHERINHDGTVNVGGRGLLGESWHFGKIILSWDDVEKGVRNFNDGHNVVLHEFSHQLDSESGSTNGAPLLHTNSYACWANVMSKEFKQLNRDFEHRHKSVMDYYGTTNPAEFFAVATETFFEKPGKMHNEHPELYQVLKNYYSVDPRRWG